MGFNSAFKGLSRGKHKMASFVSCYAHQLNVMIREASSTCFGALYFLKMFSGSADFSKLSKKLNEFDKFALDTSVQFSHPHQITTQNGHLQWSQAEKKSIIFFKSVLTNQRVT
jgi:hypothetical protein